MPDMPHPVLQPVTPAGTPIRLPFLSTMYSRGATASESGAGDDVQDRHNCYNAPKGTLSADHSGGCVVERKHQDTPIKVLDHSRTASGRVGTQRSRTVVGVGGLLDLVSCIPSSWPLTRKASPPYT